jgi:putative PIN family toxin of toxin-antitoxin system
MESNPIPATRVFVDSSVLMAAVLSHTGSAHDLILLGSKGRVVLVISSLVVTEVERNIERKAPDRLARLRQLPDIYPFEVVEPIADLVASESAKVEPKDAAIVAAAVTSNVTFLVTFDAKYLLAQAAQIETRHGIGVCPPAVAIASLVDPK